MKISKDLRLLLKPYYYINIILSLSYIVAKKLPVLCSSLFPSSETVCEFDSVSILCDILIFYNRDLGK